MMPKSFVVFVVFVVCFWKRRKFATKWYYYTLS